MKVVLLGAIGVGLALGGGLRYSAAEVHAEEVSVSGDGEPYRIVVPQEPQPVASLLPDGWYAHGSEGPVQIELKPSAILANSYGQGVQLQLTLKNEKEYGHSVRYAVEVVDSFDTHYVGPEESRNYRVGKNWEHSIEIPAGLPDGTYYLRLTAVGVAEGADFAQERDSEIATEFSIQKMVYFDIFDGDVELLDWRQYQERLSEAAGPIEETGEEE